MTDIIKTVWRSDT